jgi:hypothetical protein
MHVHNTIRRCVIAELHINSSVSRVKVINFDDVTRICSAVAMLLEHGRLRSV